MRDFSTKNGSDTESTAMISTWELHVLLYTFV